MEDKENVFNKTSNKIQFKIGAIPWTNDDSVL